MSAITAMWSALAWHRLAPSPQRNVARGARRRRRPWQPRCSALVFRPAAPRPRAQGEAARLASIALKPAAAAGLGARRPLSVVFLADPAPLEPEPLQPCTAKRGAGVAASMLARSTGGGVAAVRLRCLEPVVGLAVVAQRGRIEPDAVGQPNSRKQPAEQVRPEVEPLRPPPGVRPICASAQSRTGSGRRPTGDGRGRAVPRSASLRRAARKSPSQRRLVEHREHPEQCACQRCRAHAPGQRQREGLSTTTWRPSDAPRGRAESGCRWGWRSPPCRGRRAQQCLRVTKHLGGGKSRRARAVSRWPNTGGQHSPGTPAISGAWKVCRRSRSRSADAQGGGVIVGAGRGRPLINACRWHHARPIRPAELPMIRPCRRSAHPGRRPEHRPCRQRESCASAYSAAVAAAGQRPAAEQDRAARSAGDRVARGEGFRRYASERLA